MKRATINLVSLDESISSSAWFTNQRKKINDWGDENDYRPLSASSSYGMTWCDESISSSTFSHQLPQARCISILGDSCTPSVPSSARKRVANTARQELWLTIFIYFYLASKRAANTARQELWHTTSFAVDFMRLCCSLGNFGPESGPQCCAFSYLV